jgi:hypothetical protein
LTQSLLALAARYGVAGPGERAPLEAELVIAAQGRFAVLSALLEDDPASALEAALPDDVRSNLPAWLSPYLEQDGQLDGSLSILHEDRADGSRYHYYLHTAGGRHSLLADGAAEPYRCDQSGSGVQFGSMWRGGGGRAQVQQLAPGPLPKTLGAASS